MTSGATSSTNGRNVPGSGNRRIRVFISSTFRDMVEERNELMIHTWPALRRLCRERYVELVEVDLRWGIPESQSTRKETLKLCLDEIRACRPFFIGLLGERYGWTPDDNAFSADLQEEQPWLIGLHGKSVTELEILHGVMNNPDMAGRSLFYFRDPAYARQRGPDFLSDTVADAERQDELKNLIRGTCSTKQIPLREYSDPVSLAQMVLADLTASLDAQFPKEDAPNQLTRDARDHAAFAETRRRTYIGRADDLALDRHALGDGHPLVVIGESGIGKSALLANWVARWRAMHPSDFIVEHYVGGTVDSADHWRLMSRVIAEIKGWLDDPDPLPTQHDEIRKEFPLWLAKARAKAGREKVRVILVVDALDQLQDRDHARLVGWLPEQAFSGPLRLIVSTLPADSDLDDPLLAIRQRQWPELRVEPLSVDERRQMIALYLARYGKVLSEGQLGRLASAGPSANPLFLKILLDDLRVTGTYDRLDERLTEYLHAPDISFLVGHVLARYQHDYERDRPGLVAEALGLIYAARRGLSEIELLQLLRPTDRVQLPPAIWAPLRAALEDALVDRGGILNFGHAFLRAAVEKAFAADEDRRDELRLRLADYFDMQEFTERSSDELPWLLRETESFGRLRACLLQMPRFLLIKQRDEAELRGYWVDLGDERDMGAAYLTSFEALSRDDRIPEEGTFVTAFQLGSFLYTSALHADAEPLLRHAVAIGESVFGPDHPNVAGPLGNLALLLQTTNRFSEAEPLLRRTLAIVERSVGQDHPQVGSALNNLAAHLREAGRFDEAEPLQGRALAILERSFGPDHQEVATVVNNVAFQLQAANRFEEAEQFLRRALTSLERSFAQDHPNVASALNNLAMLVKVTGRLDEGERLIRRALAIDENTFGTNHPHVARDLSSLAWFLKATNRIAEAETLLRRALAIDEHCFGADHPDIAVRLNNLGLLLAESDRSGEAEPFFRRALAIAEHGFGPDHPRVASPLINLAGMLKTWGQFSEAEQLVRRALAIDEHKFGGEHPEVATDLKNLADVLRAAGRFAEAEPFLRRAIAITDRSFGKDRVTDSASLNDIADVLRRSNKLVEAEEFLRRGLAVDERRYGRDSPRVTGVLGNLSLLLKKIGGVDRLAEAESFARRALAIDERDLGRDHPHVAKALNNLALVLTSAERLAEAEPLLRRALEILLAFSRAEGRPHENVESAANDYAEVLAAMGRNREEIVATVRRLAPEFFPNA